MQRIVVKHLSGAKANQEQTFSVDEHPELVFGRDPSSQIAFDPDRDDVVSRRHAKLSRDDADPGRFIITDLGSRNGVLLNDRRIHGAAPLMHGDVIQLGEDGPRLRFELDPAPAASLSATRIVAPATREVSSSREPGPGANTPESVSTAASSSRPIGRATVERLLSLTQSESRRYLVKGAAAVLGVVVLAAAFFAYNAFTTRRAISQTQKQAAITGKNLERIQNAMTPTKIAEIYGPATVFLEVAWKLIDTASGKQVYHRYHYLNDDPRKDEVPEYVHLGDRIEPLLVTDEANGDVRNFPIGTVHSGSGFAIDASGFILTNRHVAAAWRSRGLLRPSQIVTVYRNRNGELEPINARAQDIQGLLSWVPAQSSLLGTCTGPSYVSILKDRGKCVFKAPQANQLEGRNDRLDVTFAGTKARIRSVLVRTSDSHDVALVKVETPGTVRSVALSPEANDTSVRAGDSITIMGFPGVSPRQTVRTRSLDMLAPLPTMLEVPNPTVTTGSIGKVIKGVHDVVGGEAADYFSECGDCYQLTANGPGSGNSGGPVFDQNGEVIAIFNAGRTMGGTTITFAVPLKFARELIGVTKALK